MESKAKQSKALRASDHQMLIVFPLGLLAMALVFDVIHFATGNSYWSEIAYWMIAAGIVGGLVAAPFCLIDWIAIPYGTRAKRIGLHRGAGSALRSADAALQPADLPRGAFDRARRG